ncbi:MAG: rhomboid family intramembrane serine protease [Pyrinomonadaceae bacterium]
MVRADRNVCRSCRAIVAAGEDACGQCGAFVAARDSSAAPGSSSSSGGNRPRRGPEAMRFGPRHLRPPRYVYFRLLDYQHLYFRIDDTFRGTETDEVLTAFGAKYNSLIDAGEWWRFVTPVFIHIGFIHLLFNMYGLWVLGPYVERLYGSAKFVVFWLAAGVAGVAASYFTVSPGMDDSSMLGRFSRSSRWAFGWCVRCAFRSDRCAVRFRDQVS